MNISTNLTDFEAEDGADEDEALSLEVVPASHGERLDRWLSLQRPHASRAYFQQLIEAGAVSIDGQVVIKPSAKLKLGSTVRVNLLPRAQDQAFEPEPMDLDVRFEDEHLMVLHKPAGLVVHPAAGHWSGTLLNGLLAHHALAPSLPRAGIVHRLDKDTSGLMLVAKSQTAMDGLTRQIAQREVHRVYVALVKGAHAMAEQSVENTLGRDPRNRLRMAVLPSGSAAGKHAHTSIRWVGSSSEGQGEPISWVTCKLHTGRTHQIRVHLTHLQHPLLGDDVYGGPAWYGMSRQALHATSLGLRHPITGQRLQVLSELPQDMQNAFALAGLRYNPQALWSTDAE